ncbi:MAG TPA: hypothetical protein VME45_14695 [Stellaceae bacterium]|nr:hypothetical protein [Stellaceae bacterium]
MGQFLLIFVTLLIPTMFFAYPPIVEQSDGECSALQQRVVDLVSRDGAGQLTVSPLYGSSSSEPNGAAFARDRYPQLPAAAGCAVAYWRSVVTGAPPAAARRSAAPAMAQSPPPSPPASPAATRLPAPAENAGNAPVAVIARDITPNGDPILPQTAFDLPMDAVAIRVEHSPRTAGALRFQLNQGRATLSTCVAQKAPPDIAWCKFDISLRKGAYLISLTAGNAVRGQFPFTVFGE